MDNHMVYFQLSLIYSLAAKRLGVNFDIVDQTRCIVVPVMVSTVPPAP